MPSYWTGISQPANGTSSRARGDVAVVQRGAARGGLAHRGDAAQRIAHGGRGARTAAIIVETAGQREAAPDPRRTVRTNVVELVQAASTPSAQRIRRCRPIRQPGRADRMSEIDRGR